jgi:hypothetical protein
MAAAYSALSGYDSVAVRMRFLHAEVCTTMLDEHVELLETPFVQQQGKTLACRELALLVLCVDALLPSAKARFCATFDKGCNLFLLYAHS